MIIAARPVSTRHWRCALAFVCLLSLLPAWGGKVYRIGLVANSIPAAELAKGATEVTAPRIIAAGLRELGWVEGKNIQLVWRTVEGRRERWPGVIDELVRMRVDVLVVFDAGAAKVALEKTSTIPIVHAGWGNLLESGLVTSFARPGGNLTGMSTDALASLNGKRLALLKATAPSITKVAFITQSFSASNAPGFSIETSVAARELSLTPFHVSYRDPPEVGAAVARAVSQGADALLVTSSPFAHYRDHQLAIHSQALRHKLPVMHAALSAAESGGLMAYGPDINDFYARAPRFIDKILRGANPAEIPIEQPDAFRFLVNLRAAKAIGLTIPPAVLAQADRVIE